MDNNNLINLDADGEFTPLLASQEPNDYASKPVSRKLLRGATVTPAYSGLGSDLLTADFARSKSMLLDGDFVSGSGGGGLSPQAQMKKTQLNEIRSTDLDEKGAFEEEMPSIPGSTPGFRSCAHLRSEEYWRAVLGQELEVIGRFKWVEHPFIQTAVGCAILASAFILSIDSGSVSPALWFFEQLILTFSAGELVVVLARRQSGVPFKTLEESVVISLDCIVVLVCVIEKWGFAILQVLHSSFGLDRDSIPRTLLRMASLFRFVRLIRIVPALHELAHGVMDALQGLFWVMVFMFLLLYAIAILCTRLIGHLEIEDVEGIHEYGSINQGSSSTVEEVQEMFQDIPTSMFFLFETMSSWTLVPLLPLFELTPWMRIFFVVFYIYAGWTLLAVMTGVVSFNMIALRAQIIREDDQREKDSKMKSREVLMEVFMKANMDRNGELSYTEFRAMLDSQEIIDMLTNLTNIKVDDLEDLWNWLDDDENGSVSLHEFLAGFTWLNEPFKPKTLLRLQEKVTHVLKSLSRRVDNFINKTFDDIIKHVQPPLSKMAAVTEQVQMLESSVQSLRMSLWKAEAQQMQIRHPQLCRDPSGTQNFDGSETPDSFTRRSREEAPLEPYSVADLEDSIGAKIDEIRMRLQKMVPSEGIFTESQLVEPHSRGSMLAMLR